MMVHASESAKRVSHQTLVVGRDPLHRTDNSIADDEGSNVHSWIRDVFLEANDLAEELQGVDDRRGFLEALHAHHANPLGARKDFQDGGVADQVRGLHEIRPGREENAPRDWDPRLAERLDGEELVARGDEAVA